jgi:hypothetical protein
MLGVLRETKKMVAKEWEIIASILNILLVGQKIIICFSKLLMSMQKIVVKIKKT